MRQEAGLREVASSRHVQGSQARSWTMGMELVVGDDGIEWTRRLSGKFKPGGGGQGSTAALGACSARFAPSVLWSSTQSVGCRDLQGCSRRWTAGNFIQRHGTRIMHRPEALHCDEALVGVLCCASACRFGVAMSRSPYLGFLRW